MKVLTVIILALAFHLLSHSQNQTILHLNANDMVYDASRNKLFAVIGGTDIQNGNNLVQINCDTKQVERKLFVGSNPELLELTSDHNYLYVALSGSPKIVRINIEKFSIDLQFPIGPIGNSINIFADDIETIPGKPNLLAVSRKEGGYVQDVVIFDNGVLLPDSVSNRQLNATEIECDSTGQVLYGFNGANTGFNFGRMNISTSGLTIKDDFDKLMDGFDLKMMYVDGLIYTNTGKVVNPHLTIPFNEGTFIGVAGGFQIALNMPEKEAYFGTFDFWSAAFRVRRYNIETYVLKDIQEFDLIFPETMSSPQLTEYICYDKNKFVVLVHESYFSDDNETYIIFIDGIYTYPTSIANIASNESDKIRVYPNPATDEVTIEMEQNSPLYKLEITRLNGQIVKSEQVRGQGKLGINVVNYNPGLYLIKIISDENTMVKPLLIK